MPDGIVLGEFAINPDCVATSADINALLRIFGFENGAVISEFPRSWVADVKSRAQQLEEPAKSAFFDKINLLKERAFVRLGRAVEGVSWIEKALASHAVRPFYGILHTHSEANYLGFSDALNDHEFPHGLRECKVHRDPDSMVNAILPLVQSSERFALIDPYFAPDEYFAKFVRKLVERNRELSHRRLYIDIHLEHDSDQRGDFGVEQINRFRAWVDRLPADLTVSVSWWKDSGVGELHPRYLITERGGVRFDRGFKIPPDHAQQQHDADVLMITDRFIREVERRYSRGYQPLSCIHSEIYTK